MAVGVLNSSIASAKDKVALAKEKRQNISDVNFDQMVKEIHRFVKRCESIHSEITCQPRADHPRNEKNNRNRTGRSIVISIKTKPPQKRFVFY